MLEFIYNIISNPTDSHAALKTNWSSYLHAILVTLDDDSNYNQKYTTYMQL